MTVSLVDVNQFLCHLSEPSVRRRSPVARRAADRIQHGAGPMPAFTVPVRRRGAGQGEGERADRSLQTAVRKKIFVLAHPCRPAR